MLDTLTSRKRIRKNYGKNNAFVPLPNLIEVQKRSYDVFLLRDMKNHERPKEGLNAVFESVFPLTSASGYAVLEYIGYEFKDPKYDVEECLQRGMTYAAQLRVKFRLITFTKDEDTNTKVVKDIKEQEVYMGDVPLMTNNGTFVVNGTERVVVSQMQRSPGVFFDHDKGKGQSSGKILYGGHIIPYRGSWLDFEFDAKDLMYARIDRRRKFPLTTFLRALDGEKTEKLRKDAAKKNKELSPSLVDGMSAEEILSTFYEIIKAEKVKDGWTMPFFANSFKGQKIGSDLKDSKGNVLAKEGDKITPSQIRQWEKEAIAEILVQEKELMGKYLAQGIVNEQTGEEIATAGAEIDKKILDALNENQVKTIALLRIDNIQVGAYIRNSLVQDKNDTREKALFDIYRIIYPGEPPTLESAEAVFNGLFFDIDRYDLSTVGRVKINERFNLELDETQRVLTKQDIINVIKTLIRIKDGHEQVDDIDHLGNRRVRSVGEMMENQFRAGLVRIYRTVRERLSGDLDTLMPQDLVNARPLQAIIHEFFGSSQLSQFMDQTNPLSEITHKRRLSALGPGGLTRERAGFEVRDVHLTHYGRICPIETPEGQNIGLINSLATYAGVNKYGFLETPYRKVVNQKVTDDVHYMTATQEAHYVIAQANATLDDEGRFTEDFVNCRINGEFTLVKPDSIDFMDVSPKQLVSVAASLIPFLENDDANRALMGSNMQRQAVPLLKTDAPLVGTGMETLVAQDSGVVITARNDGIVEQVDSGRIVVRNVASKTGATQGVDIYTLRKFQRSNHNTCINQKPLVNVGDMVKKGDIIADGPSTDMGELALGKNVLVAFMPWNGYNFEDSILISERIVRDDVFTSIHIEEFEVMARDTKLGAEEITADIPNIGEEALRSLDETGIIYIGAEVKPGDILVGKVTPKGENVHTPEEKLLHAIFGAKADDVRDTSLRVPSGVSGTVVGVRVFSRRGVQKDDRALSIDRQEIERYAKDRDAERLIYERSFGRRLIEVLEGKKTSQAHKTITKGTLLTAEKLNALTATDMVKLVVDDAEAMKKIEDIRIQLELNLEKLKKVFQERVEKLEQGDDLATGVLKMVKVFIAIKRKLQPGDKMAGRHGNKGVVSRVLPIEDMPHLEDGTPVDLCLNPLGVPSRMNVGQILETHLGWASAGIGKKIGDMIEKYQEKQNSVKDIKDYLDSVYDKNSKKILDKLKDDEVLVLANNLKKGLPVATPVFDGAKESDINDLLKEAGLSTSGQVQLIDGRTGEFFARSVTVGYIYMLKLHHLVDDKIHARSVGPYSLITQQPLGGKAQFGGQRFGEMEVWALEAYGAAYTLQEMLTIKSDDQSGRTKVYEAIIRGQDTFETGIPESFNVLIKEIRSLGLDIEMISQEKQKQ